MEQFPALAGNPEVVLGDCHSNDGMCRCYYSSLLHQLQEQHHIDGSVYSFQQFGHHYQMAYLDYIRFLIGAMWGTVTPSTCNALAEDINQGMHKRSAKHLVCMVEKADMVLSQLEEHMHNQSDTMLSLSSTHE